MCGDLSRQNSGETIFICGWVQRRRDLGSLIFIWLRDRTGIVQLVFDESQNPDCFKLANEVRSEFVLWVKGIVSLRDEKNINPELATGEVEVLVSDLKVLNTADTTPFVIGDQKVGDETKLKYRYLDLRGEYLRDKIVLKHKLTSSVREYLNANGFLDIETPILNKSTPEGARDYLVPSRVQQGKFYALPQSPQLFKQLLMVSGFDRYYQIAKCFRDEDLRADRQPEFTQIDIEMSFVDVDDVISINEGLIAKAFKDVAGVDVALPIERLTYNEAMLRYGSDKPDTRFGMEIVSIKDKVKDCAFKVFSSVAQKEDGMVCAICANGADDAYSRKDIDKLEEYAKLYGAKGLAWMVVEENGVRSPIAKFLTEAEINSIVDKTGSQTGDIIFIVADSWKTSLTAMGQVRLEVAEKLNLINESKYNFLWVTDFPMFEFSEEEGRYTAMHHPFTAINDEDLDKLESEPAKVHAKAYDIVLNGNEIGGGSIRIHTQDVQKRVFRALGFSEEDAQNRFGFLLDAFKYGTPPHGGIAYGLDRIVMLMSGAKSIRDTIAFPKVQSGSCLLTGAPDYVDETQLAELNIKVSVEEK
jgi:aspartyl-tRNA synthetase